MTPEAMFFRGLVVTTSEYPNTVMLTVTEDTFHGGERMTFEKSKNSNLKQQTSAKLTTLKECFV